ncbi:MAG: glutamine--fructose-6-phosphate transaminase (isomerizing) [Acetobacter sp.]|nr:glutamine--fructose-6-phosphate transaminase (isomerizing) [Acetobacter sp.]
MCGIVGYIGNNAVTENLIGGLKNLEYRGYDSAGIALNDNQNINIFKAAGKLGNLCDILTKQTNVHSAPSMGIGHIRWATHGDTTTTNAHPHQSNDGKLVLVHNGIIENYKELKNELIAMGFHFSSQTDTEVATHLISFYYNCTHNLEMAVLKAVKRLKGAFAFCIMHKDEPDKIIAVRQNAPLIIGLGDNENFIASDVPAIIGKVSKIIYLDDCEMAIVTRNNVIVKNFDGVDLHKAPEAITFTPDAIDKRGYKHFMLKEINEQSDIIRNLLAERMPDIHIPLQMEDLHWTTILNKKHIEIVACGTSLHAANVAKYIFEKLLRVPVTVVAASEYIYQENLTNNNTLTIGISQSGETADTITALKLAKKNKAHIVVLTNRPDSSIVRYADDVLELKAGIEVSVAATKSYTAQLISLYMFAISWTEHLNPSSETLTIKQELLMLPTKIDEILSNPQHIKHCAEKFCHYKNFIYISRGVNIATALEGALKLKEISYINASGYAAGELKHGPIALLDKSMPVLAILIAKSSTYHKVLSNCEEAKARQAPLIAISSGDDEHLSDVFDEVIYIPDISEELSPILANIPLQLLAYYVADNLGREIDQPRNLAKSVTVE